MEWKTLAALIAALGISAKATAQDATPPKEEAKAEKSALEEVVRVGESFYMPFHTFENHGLALAIMDKHLALLQEKENKQAEAEKRTARKLEYTPEAMLYFAATQLDEDGFNGVKPGETLDFQKENAYAKDAAAKKVAKASMEVKESNYQFDSKEDEARFDSLIEENAKRDEVENTELYRVMRRKDVAQSYGAKKVKTSKGEALHITKEILDRYEKDKPQFIVPGKEPKEMTKGPEALPEDTWRVSVKVECEDGLVWAHTKEYIRLRVAYNGATKKSVPGKPEDYVHMAKLIAGEDGIITADEIGAKITSLQSKIEELDEETIKKNDLSFKETAYTPGTKGGYMATIEVKFDSPETKKKLADFLAEQGIEKPESDSEVLRMIRNHATYKYNKDRDIGTAEMNKDQAETAIKAYSDKKDEDKK